MGILNHQKYEELKHPSYRCRPNSPIHPVSAWCVGLDDGRRLDLCDRPRMVGEEGFDLKMALKNHYNLDLFGQNGWNKHSQNLIKWGFRAKLPKLNTCCFCSNLFLPRIGGISQHSSTKKAANVSNLFNEYHPHVCLSLGGSLKCNPKKEF